MAARERQRSHMTSAKKVSCILPIKLVWK